MTATKVITEILMDNGWHDERSIREWFDSFGDECITAHPAHARDGRYVVARCEFGKAVAIVEFHFGGELPYLDLVDAKTLSKIERIAAIMAE